MKSIRIIIFLAAILAVAFLSLAGRCFYLQFVKHEYYSSLWRKQRQRLEFLKPQRGIILDRTGRVLAASNRIQTVFAEPRAISDPKTTSNKLAPVLDMGAHVICKLIMESRNPGFVKIKTGVNFNECTAAAKIRGIGAQSDFQRHYPTESLVSHIVGFTGTDNQGLDGIELQYDKELSGSAAQNIFFADAHQYRRPIRFKQHNGTLSDGNGIVLTIDTSIQQFARSELLKQYQSYEAQSAIAIVAEPKTGAILAMVSLPDFEPEDIRLADPNTFLNHAISDQFEPGSVLKPIAVAIALDAGVVEPNEIIFCENGDYHGKGFGRIGEYREGFGDLTVRQILVKSTNIGMAKIGQKNR